MDVLIWDLKKLKIGSGENRVFVTQADSIVKLVLGVCSLSYKVMGWSGGWRGWRVGRNKKK